MEKPMARSPESSALASLGALAHRYVDDVLVVSEERDIGEKFESLVEQELVPLGLALNLDKTAMHVRHRPSPRTITPTTSSPDRATDSSHPRS